MAELDWERALQRTKNGLEFALRNFIHWAPGRYQEFTEPKQGLFSGNPQAQTLEAALLARYDLKNIQNTASALRYRETLTYLAWLDVAVQANPQAWQQALSQQASCSWLDVGAKNWAYVGALAAMIRARRSEPFRLQGIELDPHRRYLSLQTRGQAAQAFCQAIPEARYLAGDVLQWAQPVQVISHFLPFVFEGPHLAWGLPRRYFQPQTVLNHCVSLLEPNGVMLIVNQGEVEAEAQEALLATASQTYPIRYESLGQLPAPFIQYRYARYGWFCVKESKATHATSAEHSPHHHPGNAE